MSERWADLDALIRKLGALRVAADDSRATADDRAAIEAAIARAAQAIDDMVDTPEDPKALAAVRSALVTVEQAIAGAIKGKAG